MTKYNPNYARLAGGRPVFDAPVHFIADGVYVFGPSEETYNARGWKRVVRALPAAPASAGMHWEHLGWDDSGPRIVETFCEAADPPVVRAFTPIALKRCLKLAGAWQAVKGMMDAAGDDVYDDYVMAVELKEDDPQFAPYLAEARRQYGDALVDRIIDAASKGTEHVNTLTAADLAGGAE